MVLHFGEPILTGFETTTVECSAVGGEPVEAINLTLWRNGELLAHVIGSHLSHMTTPYQYGAYRCSVDSIHETAILMERGEGYAKLMLCLKLAVLYVVPFQLLLDDIYITKMECPQVGNIRTPASPWIRPVRGSGQSVDPASPWIRPVRGSGQSVDPARKGQLICTNSFSGRGSHSYPLWQ